MNAFALRIEDTIQFNTSVNEHVEGVVLNIDVLRLPADIPADSTDYIIGHFTYFGNGSDNFLAAAVRRRYIGRRLRCDRSVLYYDGRWSSGILSVLQSIHGSEI